MVEAAKATPGQTDTATSQAASHNLFPVPRMLASLFSAIYSEALGIYCKPLSYLLQTFIAT
jgi:hypothetical protein